MVSRKLEGAQIRELIEATCNDDGGNLSEEMVEIVENQNLIPPMNTWKGKADSVRKKTISNI